LINILLIEYIQNYKFLHKIIYGSTESPTSAFLVREETFKWLTVRASDSTMLFYRWNNVLSDFWHTMTAHVPRDAASHTMGARRRLTPVQYR